MRTYGRLWTDGVPLWIEVDPDSNGDPSQIYLTTLLQCLQLVLGESPFYANYGVPDFQAVQQQQFPDFYVARTQQQFSQYFASLTIIRQNNPAPTYNVTVIFKSGARIAVTVIPKLVYASGGAPELNQYGDPITSGTITGQFIPQ